MNLFEISKIPFKEKKLLVAEACLMYRKLKQVSKQLEETEVELSDVVRMGNLQNIKSLSMFETIMGLLEPDHAFIIESEFLNNEKTRETIGHKWSKSTYYKAKHGAIDNFIFLLFA